MAGGASSADRLAPWLARPGRAAVLADFDGTLAPIVDEPSAAVPLPGAPAVLARLAQRYAVVAVISGRPVSYLADRLGSVAGLVLVGLYGLERTVDGETEEHPEGGRWRDVIATVAAAAEAAAPPGAQVERKGLAVTIHWRTAPGAAPWAEAWAAATAAGTGLTAHPGRRSVELRPPVGTDKGTVVAGLAAGLDAVCFLGDDLGDLPAFETLQRLARQGVHTLAVAVDSDEAPAGLLAAADLVVPGPPGALALLDRLAGGDRPDRGDGLTGATA